MIPWVLLRFYSKQDLHLSLQAADGSLVQSAALLLLFEGHQEGSHEQTQGLQLLLLYTPCFMLGHVYPSYLRISSSSQTWIYPED